VCKSYSIVIVIGLATLYSQNHLRRTSHQNQAVTINRSSQCIISTNDVPFKDIKQSNDSTFMDFLNDDSAFVTVQTTPRTIYDISSSSKGGNLNTQNNMKSFDKSGAVASSGLRCHSVFRNVNQTNGKYNSSRCNRVVLAGFEMGRVC